MTRTTSVTLVSAVCLPLWAGFPTPARAECSDPSGLCLAPGSGAKWEQGASLSAKQRAAKRKGNPGTLNLSLDDGRASVFIDGRFVAVAPLSSHSLSPGKHHIQVRDGMLVLTEGVLTVPSGASLDVTVAHK